MVELVLQVLDDKPSRYSLMRLIGRTQRPDLRSMDIAADHDGLLLLASRRLIRMLRIVCNFPRNMCIGPLGQTLR